MNANKSHRFYEIYPLALFTVSCFLPSFDDATTVGLEYLITGALSFVDEHRLLFICWLANPIFFLSLILSKLRLRKSAVVASAIAATLSLLVFLIHGVPTDFEETYRYERVHPDLGAFLWVASMIFLFSIELYKLYMHGRRPADTTFSKR